METNPLQPRFRRSGPEREVVEAVDFRDERRVQQGGPVFVRWDVSQPIAGDGEISPAKALVPEYLSTDLRRFPQIQ